MTTEATPKAFDPKGHLTRVTGRDYLEVKWRLVWLRAEHPEAIVQTEMVGHDDAFALFKATVSIPGAGSATGHGREEETDFHDYVEKAETKAIGRALAALGYGTQFCEDYQEGHVADNPVEGPSGPRPVVPPRPADPPAQAGAPRKASPAQLKAIHAAGRALGAGSDAEVDERVVAKWGAKPADLTMKQASEVIDALRAQQGQRAGAVQPVQKPKEAGR